MAEADRPQLLHIEPQLYVTDFAVAVGFFREKLGFELAFDHGDPPFYGQVARDGVRINLRHLDQALVSAALMAREPDLICASIPVLDAGALYREFERRGTPFHQRLKPTPWGAPGTASFIVQAPDNNLIFFVGAAGD